MSADDDGNDSVEIGRPSGTLCKRLVTIPSCRTCSKDKEEVAEGAMEGTAELSLPAPLPGPINAHDEREEAPP